MTEHHTPTDVGTPTPAHAKPRAGSIANLGVPLAIFVSAILVAGAILYTNGTFTSSRDLPNFASGDAAKITPVTAEDHILGNPNAPVILVEYSDFNCPYCQVFHESMNQLMREHGAQGNVAWVYRHFPVITEDSPKLALATECVAAQGGDDAFWKIAQTFFDRPQGTHVDMSKLDAYVSQTGIDMATYADCVNNGTHTERIKAIMDNASILGVGGTPHTFVLVNGKVREIGGALPYAKLTQELSKIIEEVRD